MTHPTQPNSPAMSDVKCPDPACEHEADHHSTICLVGLCPCQKPILDVYRAAYAASEAALAERDATITFLRGELAEARADYDDVLRERNEARAEVERLTLALQDEDQVCDALTVTCKSCDGAGSFNDNRGCHDCVGRGYTVRDVFADIAAERQQIAEAVSNYVRTLAKDCLLDDERYNEGLILEDRIVSGGFAAKEEVRDG